tara:strand:+ start:240 stop:548 length:309 start_codon:yes stop_codon:yes gene_type:complete
MSPIITKLAGVTFDNCQQNIRFFSNPDLIYDLEREFNNQYDPFAIKVTKGPHKLGYLPKHIAQQVAPLIDNGRCFVAEHLALNEFPPHETVGLTVRIRELTQ